MTNNALISIGNAEKNLQKEMEKAVELRDTLECSDEFAKLNEKKDEIEDKITNLQEKLKTENVKIDAFLSKADEQDDVCKALETTIMKMMVDSKLTATDTIELIRKKTNSVNIDKLEAEIEPKIFRSMLSITQASVKKMMKENKEKWKGIKPDIFFKTEFGAATGIKFL